MMIVICSIVVLLGVWAILIYNSLIRQQNLMREAWSGIDVQLKRRSELIPNLVAVVQGYMSHERKTLEEVTALRSRLAVDPLDRAKTESDLSRGLKSVLAVVENYPDLKANQNFLDLQKNLVEIEDQLQMARRYYNGTVRDYNVQAQSFPGILVARLFKFQPAEFFEIEYATDRKNPDVKFT